MLADANFEGTSRAMRQHGMWSSTLLGAPLQKSRSRVGRIGNLFEGRVKVVKSDNTEDKAIDERFGVRGYPTIKFFPRWKEG